MTLPAALAVVFLVLGAALLAQSALLLVEYRRHLSWRLPRQAQRILRRGILRMVAALALISVGLLLLWRGAG